MIRLSAALFCLFAVFGCSTSVPRTPKPMSFEDSFRHRGRAEYGTPFYNKIPYLNRFFMNTAYGYGDFVWDDELGNSTVLVSPDGRWLLTGRRSPDISYRTNRGMVSLWSLTDPDSHLPEIVPFDDRSASVDWLAFTPDASEFFVFRRPSGNYKPGMLKRYARVDGKELQTISESLAAQTGGVSPDGRKLVALTLNSLEVWNAADGEKIGSVPLGETVGVHAIRFSPDSRLLFVGCATNKINVFDLEHGKCVASLPTTDAKLTDSDTPAVQLGRFNEPQYRFDVSPDGKTLLIAQAGENLPDGKPGGRIQIVEIGSWRLLREIEPKLDEMILYEIQADEMVLYEIQAVGFSPEGDKIYCAGFASHKFENAKLVETFLGEFDLTGSEGAWSAIPYETLPLHPIGKRLLMHPDGSDMMLTTSYERVGIDFNVSWKNGKD